MCKNYKRSAPERARILACAIGRLKRVVILESRVIARVAYLGQITNTGGGRAGKLQKERSHEDRDISVHDWARENGCHLRITRNCTGSIFRLNNKYWKWSRVKIIKEHSRKGRVISMHDWAREKCCCESSEIIWVAYLGQIMNIGSGCARKL